MQYNYRHVITLFAALIAIGCNEKRGKKPVINPNSIAEQAIEKNTKETGERRNIVSINSYTPDSTITRLTMMDTLEITMSSCFGCANEGIPFQLVDSKGIIKEVSQSNGGKQPEGTNGGSTSITILALPTGIGSTTLYIKQSPTPINLATDKEKPSVTEYKVQVEN
jgi:hypothetical protein